MSDITLETKLVGEIKGEFFVPSYQRGYRWGEEEVERLLEDIYVNGDKNYCLQPIVIRKLADGKFELIDGQQRLTTLYIILKFMQRRYPELIEEIDFSLEYETRKNSGRFLQDIELSQRNDNIDYFFMCQAYETIENWFEKRVKNGEKRSNIAFSLYSFLCKDVKVIWYEVNDEENSYKLFTRLNIGKIPLTSSELVKAMFLSTDNNKGMTEHKQNEISTQWDSIERQLHNSSLWYFLTNQPDSSYSTKLDIILDLMSGKKIDERDKYFTFFFFDDLLKKKEINEIWSDIQHCFLILKDWFENHELYHKIGYLIASDSKTLKELYEESKGKTKSQFRALLNDFIRESIAFGNYGELNYKDDYSKIMKLLLLFNVISVMKIDEQAQRFPFDKFKHEKNNHTGWSLEHIHAQQSRVLQKHKEWIEWLTLQLPSLKAVSGMDTPLINEIEDILSTEKIDGLKFEELQQKVYEVLSDGRTDYIHTIANLALLDAGDNAALNNSTFDVKRNDIINMDKAGKFIPYCTKMVFLKYYTKSDKAQLHFWGEDDRQAYISEMNKILDKYLGEPIVIGN
ncbi:MAG: DUF262 domain-containing HNH endonuclease family protein [Clostridia bacterium]|nr:DUF262 domain-containing HNH endonuclease family protein [Clostridia bacterium]